MLLFWTALAASSLANADVRQVLREQGFDGPLNGREQITYAGHITQGRDDYRIYVFRGVFKAAVVDHGVGRIIVMLNGRYFGSYHIPMPTNCRVRARSVICNTESPGVIEFSKAGPPAEIWFDGEISHFELATQR